MIVCPNCLHQNPDGASHCEACYTKLPATSSCPNCGSPVQVDASFCGQCGFHLKQAIPDMSPAATVVPFLPVPDPLPLPELVAPDPLVPLEPLPPGLEPVAATTGEPFALNHLQDSQSLSFELPENRAELAPPPPPPPSYHRSMAIGGGPKTQIQQSTARLLHLQTNTALEIPQHLAVVHLGKPNDRIPPDLNMAGLPNSEVVSRIHADLRVEGDTFFIEDVGSANGTYINNLPLPPGNRHHLRSGDRISLGKGDLVTFLFQQS